MYTAMYLDLHGLVDTYIYENVLKQHGHFATLSLYIYIYMTV